MELEPDICVLASQPWFQVKEMKTAEEKTLSHPNSLLKISKTPFRD